MAAPQVINALEVILANTLISSQRACYQFTLPVGQNEVSTVEWLY